MSPDAGKACIAEARSFLFVPGDRPERFDKAASSGADIVILDLEDAVAPAAKDRARDEISAWLAQDRRAVVRINAFGSGWFENDLALWRNPNLLGIMLPKAEPGIALTRVASLRPTIALVESAKGIAGLLDIAAVPGVIRLAFGTIDLALDLDLTASDTAFDPIRLEMTVASRVHRIAAPIEGVSPDFRDLAATRAGMAQARAFGFGAKMCIHPAQIAAVHAALHPSDTEIEHARRVIAADETSGGGAVALDGGMVDRPLVERSRRILARLRS